MKRPFLPMLGLLLLIAGPSQATENETWSLEACSEQALQVSPTLAISRARLEAARQQQHLDRANRYPILSLSGRGDFVSETMSLDIPLPPIPGYTPPQLEFGDGTQYDLALGIAAPLYTGGAMRAMSLASQREFEASTHDQRADSLRVLYDLRIAFFRALSAEAARDAAQIGVDLLERHRTEVTAAIEQGMAGQEALLLTESHLNDARKALFQGAAALSAARLELGRLVGRTGSEVIPAGALETSILPADVDSEQPLQNRPDLTAIDSRIQSASLRTGAVKSAYLPTVSAMAGLHYGKPGVDQISNEWMDYATIGVRASWTLFDWGVRASKVQIAQSSQSRLSEMRRELEEQYRSRLATAWKRFQATNEELQLALQQVTHTESRLELLRERYRNGFASESEMLDGQDNRTQADIRLVSVYAKLRIAEADLLFLSGK